MDDVAIKVDNVSKIFKLPHEKYSSVKSLFVNFYRSKHSYELQKALNGVSFEIKKGEFFGIVGRNGSGKSTLLKLMAGIYVPTGGDIKINGSLTPFIELGVGFNQELTGRENVFLNGALLGFGRKQMLEMYDEIVEFAELKRFMDQKLKNYSSGMQVRLAFSIAIRAQSDILLLDEVLAVGDAAFQQKCLDYFVKLKEAKKTIVLVSHNMQTIEQFCDRVVFIEEGKIRHIGEAHEVARMYEEMFLQEEAERVKTDRDEQKKLGKDVGAIEVHGVKVLQDGKTTKHIQARRAFVVQITLSSKTGLEKANVGINIKNRDKVMLVSTDTLEVIGGIELKKRSKTIINFKIENILTDGIYIINIGVADIGSNIPRMLFRQEHIQEFTVSGIGTHAKSLTHPSIKVELG